MVAGGSCEVRLYVKETSDGRRRAAAISQGPSSLGALRHGLGLASKPGVMLGDWRLGADGMERTGEKGGRARRPRTSSLTVQLSPLGAE